MSAPVRIGERLIAAGRPAYIVAEVGINHNGDMALAKKSIEAAKESGADAVKFQNYRTEDFVPTRSEIIEYVSNCVKKSEPQHDLFKRHEIDDAAVTDLYQHATRVGIDFHSTPTHPGGVDLLKAIGVGVLKNGSDYLSHLPLVEHMARSGLPTVLSTGMASLEEVDEAAAAFRAAGGEGLIVLHCVSQYPAPFDQLRLRRMQVLARRLDCAVGFSDHSHGHEAAVLAVALGACWIEKHFTLDQSLEGPDHWFSSEPAEFRRLVDEVRRAETAMRYEEGDAFSDDEQRSRTAYRLSCAAARALAAGTVASLEDIGFFRPGAGHPPKAFGRFVGRRLARDVALGELLTDDMFAS